MNAADAFTLAVSMLQRGLRRIEDYDGDPDDMPEDVLEEIRTMNEDALTHLADAGLIDERGAIRTGG